MSQDNAEWKSGGFTEVNAGEGCCQGVKDCIPIFLGYLSIGFANRVVDTFITRIDPMALLSNMQIPEWGIDWLKARARGLNGGAVCILNRSFHFRGLNLAAALPAFLVAVFTRRLLGTVMIGLLSLMKLRNFF